MPSANFPSSPTGITPSPAPSGSLVAEREPQNTPSPPTQNPELPPNSPSSQPTFTWGQLDGQDFSQAIPAAYAEAAHWNRNLFLMPSGNAGKDFVTELVRLFRSYAEASALESVALKAAMVMLHLLLQKPFASSKAKDHCEILSRRLRAWKTGDLDGLLCEERMILQHAKHVTRHQKEESLASSFSKMMLAGRTNAALRLLTKEGCGSVLPLDQVPDPSYPSARTVLDALKAKHLPPQPVNQQALLTNTDLATETHPILFDSITSSTIRSATLRYSGSAGPSSLNATAWRRICTSFKSVSTEAMPWHSWRDASAPSMWTQRVYLPSQPAV